MAILSVKDELIIPYPDFQMGKIIDPEEHDLNNRYMVSKINEVIDFFNEIMGNTAGTTGAEQLTNVPVAPFISTTIQGTLNELVTRIESTVEMLSGADLVGSTAIEGVDGLTVQSQLASLKVLRDDLLTLVNNNKQSTDADFRKLSEDKADRTEVYTTSRVDALLDEKVSKNGNFTGTWNGMTISEAGSESINGARLDFVEPIVIALENSLSNFDLIKRELATLKLYQSALERVPNGILFGTEFDTKTFGMVVDFAKSRSTSAIEAGSTSITVANASEFRSGTEVTIYDDVNNEYTEIISVNGNVLTVKPIQKPYKANAGVARTMGVLDTQAKTLSFGQYQDVQLLYTDVRFRLDMPYESIALFISHGDGMILSGEVDGIPLQEKILEGIVNVTISEVI